MLTTIALSLVSFFAGLTDSIVGGGGLIQVPSMFIALPNTPQADILGTGKVSAVMGTSAAMVTYLRRVRIDLPFTAITATSAAFASLSGAWLVSRIHPSEFKPLILLVVVVMAGFTFLHKNFGTAISTEIPQPRKQLLGLLIGMIVGFYDGFFGPGTGTILIFLFVYFIGMDFLGASAHAKVVNVATNLGALIYFGGSGHVIVHLAIPMAVCNICGGLLGARLAIQRGNLFVRSFFQLVISVVIARFAWDVFIGPR